MKQMTAPQASLLRLLRGGPRSRVELADDLGFSRPRLSVELDRLMGARLAEDAGPAASRGGRRSGMVRLARGLRFGGVDIGATSLDVAVTNGELEILGHLGEPCDVAAGPAHVLGRAVELFGKLGADRLHGVGIGVPGPVSFRDGTPIVPPIMPGWDRYPVREAVGQELRCPVVLDNDVNIMALGELHAGVAKRVGDFLLIKLGTGIGCGIVVDGRIYRGVSGSAGDIGHIQVEEQGPACACGNTGCLEAYFGGAALARQARAIAAASPYLARKEGPLTAEDVADAAAQGDPEAARLVREGGRRVGQVLAGLVSFFDPGMVIVAGGVAGLGHVLLAEIRSTVYRRSLPLATGNLPIVLSELGGTAGVIGAARLITDHVWRAA